MAPFSLPGRLQHFCQAEKPGVFPVFSRCLSHDTFTPVCRCNGQAYAYLSGLLLDIQYKSASTRPGHPRPRASRQSARSSLCCRTAAPPIGVPPSPTRTPEIPSSIRPRSSPPPPLRRRPHPLYGLPRMTGAPPPILLKAPEPLPRLAEPRTNYASGRIPCFCRSVWGSDSR